MTRAIILSAAAGLLFSHAALAQCNPVPTPIGSYAGTDGVIYCSTVFDDGTGPALYVGGSFSIAGNTVSPCIAKWNGQAFVPVVTTNGKTVRAMAIDGNSLLFGGGSVSSAGLYRLQNGTVTTASPALGTNSQINVIRVAADGIYVGGKSPSGGFAVLQSGAWVTVGNGVNGEILALENIDGRWVVGGTFTRAGAATGIDANSIAAWDGTQWSAYGAGLNGTVYSLMSWNNELVAAGDFEDSGGAAVRFIGRFDGTQWNELGNGLEGPVFGIQSIDGSLVACGAFASSNGATMEHVARLNAGAWEPVANGLNNDVRTLASFNGDLHAGGTFTAAQTSRTMHIASLHEGHWQPLLDGTDGAVSGMTVFNNQLIVSGSFTRIAGLPIRRMAAFDGDSWTQFGSDTSFSANGFTEFQGQLIAVGSFEKLNGPTGAARFNGTTWDPMGVLEGSVKGVHVYNGELYAFGYGLLRSGSTPAHGLAKWDGSAWVNGIPGATTAINVNGVETYNNRLYFSNDIAGTLQGVFDISGAAPVMVMSSTRYALKAYNGRLYAGGGNFTINYWNGTTTFNVNAAPISGTSAMVDQFVVHGGRLYAIGWFPTAQNAMTNTVLKIVDVPGSQTAQTAVPVAMASVQQAGTGQSYGGSLYIGGSFKAFGPSINGGSSAFLSTLTCVCAADFNNDQTVDIFDYLDFLQPFSVQGVAADFNSDGVVDFFDYLDFIDAFSRGC